MVQSNGGLLINGNLDDNQANKPFSEKTVTKVYSFHRDDTEDQNAQVGRGGRKTLGSTGALFHIIKGSLGSGIMTMPYSFMNGGLWTSLLGTIFVGVLYAHCIHIFVGSSRVLCSRVKKGELEFAELTEEAFQTGPAKLRPYTQVAKSIVDVGLSICYYLSCVVYIVFSASSVQQIVELNSDLRLDIRVYVMMMTVFIMPLGMIRDLKYLVPFSLLAIVALVFGCGFVLYDVLQDLPPLSSRPAFTSFDRLPVFFATLLYSMNGMGTILPVENSMKNPDNFLGYFGVLNISIAFLTLLNCTMGFFGYWRFGDDTLGTITLNISSSSLGQAVKVLVSLNVLCTYGLYFYVLCEVPWRLLRKQVKRSKETCSHYSLRITLTLSTVLLAVAVPNLEPFVNLSGAIFSSTLMLFFPAVIELVTFWEDESYMGSCHWRVYKNFLLIVLWAVALVTGTKCSIMEIISLYS